MHTHRVSVTVAQSNYAQCLAQYHSSIEFGHKYFPPWENHCFALLNISRPLPTTRWVSVRCALSFLCWASTTSTGRRTKKSARSGKRNCSRSRRQTPEPSGTPSNSSSSQESAKRPWKRKTPCCRTNITHVAKSPFSKSSSSAVSKASTAHSKGRKKCPEQRHFDLGKSWKAQGKRRTVTDIKRNISLPGRVLKRNISLPGRVLP